MYKKNIITLVILFAAILNALKLEYFPPKPLIESRGQFSVITNLQAYEDKPGTPMLPLEAVYVKIPAGKKIGQVNIEYQEVESIHLSKPLLPVQTNQPLSMANSNWVSPKRTIYSKQQYPEQKLVNIGHGFSGGSKIATISFYTLKYLPLRQSLEFPNKIVIEYELEPTEEQKKYVDRSSLASWQTQQKMGLSTPKTEQEPVYLLIVPQQFQTAYQPLVEWRKKQGISVIVGIYEDIITSYEGEDEQEKMRNFVTDKYQQQGVSHLTIGADASLIPSRIVFAFDCDYGLQNDENDLRCDMYFGCLDGSWDANGNGIYGEDDDETDYLAEVFVARIPAETTLQVSNYIERLIDYEKGNITDYQKAGGLSMELWSGAQSEVCQQFIYEKYFSEDYQIDFLYGTENSGANAYDLINTNINFMQHTGHAWYTVLSLESGSISINSLYNMQNDWGGLFYSIGCWAAALDYDAIAEDIVRQTDSGFLGFIGNSRYGWGAPAAPAFGFSEFYQKEMFRLLFQENITDLAQLNYAQKIPYFPYFAGTSIYKWVGYELNALGDSYCRFNTHVPAEMQLTAVNLADSVRIKVTAAGLPVPEAVVSLGTVQKKTDQSGEVVFPYAEQTVSVYKYGYQFIQTELEQIAASLALTIETEVEPSYVQGEQLQVETKLYNNSSEAVSFEVNYLYNEVDIGLEVIGEQPNWIAGNSNVSLAPLQLTLIPVPESYQMQNGKTIPVVQQIIDVGTDEVLAEHTYELKIEAPAFQIANLQWENYSLEAGSTNDFYFELQNTGELVAENIQIDFGSNSEWVVLATETVVWEDPVQPAGSIIISNQLQIAPNCPEEFWVNLQLLLAVGEQYNFSQNISIPNADFGYNNDFETSFNWNGEDSWQRVDTYAAAGEYSLSCRPENIGYYATTSDYFYYLPGMELDFKYRYKMPMYGEDGFYVLLQSQARTDTLIFLGAGGALPPEDGENSYIEAGWNQYSLNIAELTTTAWETGELFQLEFLFSFPELEAGFNEYGNMPQIGVFIDDLALTTMGNVDNDMGDISPVNQLQAYPNPFNPQLTIEVASQESEILEIYNVKGQKVTKLKKEPNQKTLQWNASDMASGIYFVRWQKDNTIVTKKILLLK